MTHKMHEVLNPTKITNCMECTLVSAAGVLIHEVLSGDVTALLISTQFLPSFIKQRACIMNALETSKSNNTIFNNSNTIAV